jgi:hypothetical protein
VRRSGNRNGRRHQFVELAQATPLLVVRDSSGWRCCLGVGEAPRRGPSTSGSYRFQPRPSPYRDRSRLGHQLGVRSSCHSSSASSAARVNPRRTDTVALHIRDWPLYLGQNTRIATPAQRVALHTRDRGCTRPRLRWPGPTARSITRSAIGPTTAKPTSTTSPWSVPKTTAA